MTDYNAMSHQQLYSYVWSGSPSAVEGEATLNQAQSKAITSAANNLFTTLTKIQSSWSGAAADEFTQQTNAILNQMKDHAEAAQKIYTAMSHASSVLQWAQTYMPSPPSEAEDAIADIDKNGVVGTILGIGTFGTSTLASEAAEKDIEAKKATAVHVMTALASAYTTAAGELTRTSIADPITDPIGSGTSGKKSKSGSSGSSSSAATNAAAAGMMLPYAAGVVAAHTNGAGAGSSVEHSYTDPKTSTSTGSTTAPPSGTTGTGSGSTGTGTVTSGLGATSTTSPGSTPIVASTSSSSGYGSSGPTNDVASFGTAGSLGSYGSSGLISDGDSSGYGAGGSGSYGSYGSAGSAGSGTQASGGTGTGEIGGEEAGGAGTGLIGSSANTGTSAAAAAGDSSGSGSSMEGMGGMMGGMGMGRGAGGGGEDRGSRASWLKEDEDFWYSEKMKNAAPPGGLIE